MKNYIIAVTGWGLALALGIGLVLQQQKMTARVAELSAQLEVSTTKITTLEKQQAELQALAKAEAAQSLPADKKQGGLDPAAMFKGLLGSMKDRAAKEGSGPEAKEGDAPKPPFSAMFEGEQGERLMESGMEMSVSMQYGGLFADLNLSPEKEAALKEALLNHQRALAQGGMAHLRGEKLPENWQPPTDEDLLASVKDLLSPEEYDQFAAYQDELPERMMRQQVESQLGMFASGLSDEAYATTVDVLVEKLTAATQAQVEQLSAAPSDPAAAASNMGNVMQTAYDEALAELETSLSPEDTARVRRYVEQQRSMFEMFANMSSETNGANIAVTVQGTSPRPKDQ